MQETTGTINLKILRLQQQLNVLDEQYRLSRPYPNHQADLASAQLKTQVQLGYLLQAREALCSKESFQG